MRIDSIGHACLEIEVSGLRVVTDPWWTGPAYTNQWYPWPTPKPNGLEERPIDYLFLSHGHEDHLHPDTLRRLRPGATALVPSFLIAGMADYVRELGFREVIELRHGETVRLRNGLRATCYLNLNDSILVLEGDGHVLVNANDALHASPPAIIGYFCRLLAERHPHIDTLFLGYGTASWFPNCFRMPGKDDRAVARERESRFTENFIRIVEELSPRLACAFAASFVLLEEHNRWINEVRFEMPGPDREYERRGSGRSRCHLLLPGDRIEGVEVRKGPTPRPDRSQFRAACEGELAAACRRAVEMKPLDTAGVQALVDRLDTQVRRTAGARGGAPLHVELRLRDNPGLALEVVVDRFGARAFQGSGSGAPVTIELRAEILEAALAHDYGFESLVIGYGADVKLADAEHFAGVQRLLALLSPRRAGWRALVAEVQRSPRRVVQSAWRQRWPLAAYVGFKLGLISHAYEPKLLGAEDPAGMAVSP